MSQEHPLDPLLAEAAAGTVAAAAGRCSAVGSQLAAAGSPAGS